MYCLPIKFFNVYVGYVGIDLAAFLAKDNAIHDIRSKNMFVGLPDFQAAMPRDKFKAIWSCLRFYPQYDHEGAVHDPLWYSRYMFHHSMVNATSYAVPLEVLSLDENEIACKVTQRFNCTWNQNQLYPEYGFMLRCSGSHDIYSRCEIMTQATELASCLLIITQNYSKNWKGLWETKMDANFVPQNCSSVLCDLQMSHASLVASSLQSRIVVPDNYYKRHNLSE